MSSSVILFGDNYSLFISIFLKILDTLFELLSIEYCFENPIFGGVELSLVKFSILLSISLFIYFLLSLSNFKLLSYILLSSIF